MTAKARYSAALSIPGSNPGYIAARATDLANIVFIRGIIAFRWNATTDLGLPGIVRAPGRRLRRACQGGNLSYS